MIDISGVNLSKVMKYCIVMVLLAALGGLFVLNRQTSPLLQNVTADRVLIEKRSHRLTLLSKGSVLKSYRIAIGRGPEGKKTTEGDGKTPEGLYTIDRRKPNSGFHRALHISYPNADDRKLAAERGVSPGGDIMIRGLVNSLGWIGKLHLVMDWTAGCIAMTNWEVDEIWRAAPDGTVVEIVP